MDISKEIRENARILIVDDSESVRRKIVKMLEEENFRIYGDTNSVEKAIEIITTQGINIIILDVVMPKLSGIDFAEYMKESNHHAYMIMISSIIEEFIIIDSISKGANEILPKPVIKEDLVSILLKICNEIKNE